MQKEDMTLFAGSWPVKCQNCDEIFDLSGDFQVDKHMREEFIYAMQMRKLMGKLYCLECR